MAFIEDAVIVNALMRQALIAAQEVMGENGLNAVLRLTGLERYIGNLPPDDMHPAVRTSEYAHFNESIENIYGRGGRGVLRRVGKASFQYAVREQAALLGLASVALKILPEKQRIRFILNSMVNALKKTNSQVEAWVDETPDGKIAYVERTCAVCYGRKSSQPVCYLYIGSVAEAVRWATGMEHEVQETHCVAKGDDFCRFEIGEILR